MKKILFVSNTANFSKFNLPFMRWCRENAWRVDYASPNDEEVKDCDKFFDVEMARSPFALVKNVRAVRTLKKILAENNYDILHCHTPMGAAVARLAARKLWKQGRIKIIYTAHGFHFFKGAPLLNWLVYYPVEKYLARFTDVLILINEEDYERAVKKRFKAKKIVKIDGVGVNLEQFYPVD